MLSRTEIKIFSLDHENETYNVEETVTLNLDSNFIQDSEILTLLKAYKDTYYFAKSHEYFEKDYTGIVSYNNSTQEWSHYL